MADDNQNHLVSQVIGGQIEPSDVQVQNVTITSMSEEIGPGREDRPWYGPDGYRSLLLRAELARAADRALAAERHLLPESRNR